MTTYLVRVELKEKQAVSAKATDWHYGKLHSAMEQLGFQRHVVDADGTVRALPTAEYIGDSNYDLDGIAQLAKQTASEVWQPNWVLTCAVSRWVFDDK